MSAPASSSLSASPPSAGAAGPAAGMIAAMKALARDADLHAGREDVQMQLEGRVSVSGKSTSVMRSDSTPLRCGDAKNRIDGEIP